jgi:hypothetical protein
MANPHVCYHGGDWQCTDGSSLGVMSATGWRYFAHQRRYFDYLMGRRPKMTAAEGYAQYVYNANLRAWTRGE